jgi:Nickel responsive protein SCO4226-like
MPGDFRRNHQCPLSSDAEAPNQCWTEEAVVPLFLIERNFAEFVRTDPETNALVKEVNDELGIQWLFSFLSADKRKTYCLYEAPDPEAIRAAAKRLGVPADTIVEIGGEIGPLAEMMAPVREKAGLSDQPR